MATVGRQELGRQSRGAAGESETLAPAVGSDQTFLAVLLWRGLSKVASWVAPVGRFSLYIGLLLVAFTALRLPNDTGAVADVFLFVSMVCALLRSMQGRALRIGLLKTHAIGLTLVVSGVVIGTLAQSFNDWQSMLRLAKFLFATTATIVACMVLLERHRQLRVALACWAASAAFSSFVGLMQFWFGDSFVVGIGSVGSRVTGLSNDANALGQIAGVAIAGCLSLAAASDRLRAVLWSVAALLCIVGVFGSASRIGAVIAVASLAIWGVMVYRLRRQLTMIVVGCCVAGAAVATFVTVQDSRGSALTERLAIATPEDDRSVSSRLSQYDAALRQGLQSPVVGLGLGERYATVHGIVIHNTILTLLRAGGLLSVVGIIIIFGDLLRVGVSRYQRSRDPADKILIAGLLCGVVGLVLDGLTSTVLYQREVWVPAALLFAFSAMTDRRRETQGSTPLRAGRSSERRRHSGRHRPKRARSPRPDTLVTES